MIINDKRELAYVVLIDGIEPIEGADKVETAIVGGWRVMVRKEQFKVGDKAIYFEIDSKVPSNRTEFEFLSKKNWKIKTQKYFKGKVISQGLLMSFEDFGWDSNQYDVHQPLTDALEVTYAVEEDNKRKNSPSKYENMRARHKELFKKQPFKFLMSKSWGRKILFIFFGKKRDNPRSFPKGFPYVSKTDEERVENMPWVLGYKDPLILTEKLDGTSCTYILEKKKFGKYEFYVSSRNIRQLAPEQETYHQQTKQSDVNIYWELAFKYNIKEKLQQYLEENPELIYVCIQGEGVGQVQGNPLKLDENRLYVFNFIRSDVGRLPSTQGKEIIDKWNMNWVPIISTEYYMPDNMEEFKIFADGNSVVNPNVLREGFVLRDPKTNLSFKNVSRNYLLAKGE